MHNNVHKDKDALRAEQKIIDQLRKEREDALSEERERAKRKANAKTDETPYDAPPHIQYLIENSKRQREEQRREEQPPEPTPPPPAPKIKKDEPVIDDDDWSRAVKAGLPDGLRVIAVEYVCKKEVLDLDTEGREVFATFTDLLRHFGTVSVHKMGQTRFGPNHYTEESRLLRVDIIVKQSSLARFGSDIFKFTGSKQDIQFSRSRCNTDENMRLEHFEVLDTMAHRCSGDERDCEWRGRTSDMGFAEWAKAEAERSEVELSQYMQLQDICNGDLFQILILLDNYHRKPLGPQTYLVEGLIARGIVTLMLGKKGVGKTNVGLELAVDTAEQRNTWLGFPLKPNGGLCVYLFGEDSPENVEGRIRAMNGGRMPITLRPMPYDGREIKTIVKELGNLKIDLIIIDPARKFYEGDEDGSDAVSSFFTKVENIARDKKAAVLVCHHLKRGSTPKDIHDVPHWMRGSQVFLDRPRTILALHRVGTKTTFGIPAPNNGDPLHNLPASIMFNGVRRLQRDEATFRHVPLEGEQHAKDTSDEGRVMAALRGLVKKGATVTSSDERELFTWTPSQLEGMSRAAVRKAVKSLLDAGQIVRSSAGTLAPKADD
jgi:hypothetical protein